MNILLIDGNSIINRAFYGMPLLSNGSGQITNAIQGFCSVLLKLENICRPTHVAIAFDVKHPTFRHKMFEEYKAGRHATPPELLQQFPILKQLLKHLGYTCVEEPGFEADDILGTLSAQCKGDDKCFVATGDRDALQLVSKNTHVLLSSTKKGKPVTVEYDEKTLFEEYELTPNGMLQLKALMGDSSDNIPGVAGIGKKGGSELIQKFGSIDYIYSNLDDLDIKPGMKSKLENGRDSAFLSLTLGTICKDAPIDKNLSHYEKKQPDAKAAISLLSSLEMFSMIEKFHLSSDISSIAVEAEKEETVEQIEIVEQRDLPLLLGLINKSENIYFNFSLSSGKPEFITIFTQKDKKIHFVESNCFDFDMFVDSFFASKAKKHTFDCKEIFKFAIKTNREICNLCTDTTLLAYVLDPLSSNYDINKLALSYDIPSPALVYDENLAQEIILSASKTALIEEVSQKQWKMIDENNQRELVEEIEMPLANVLASMELEGMPVDKNAIEEYQKRLQNEIDEISGEIFLDAGEKFNLNSPKQLGHILFEKLNLPAKKKTKTGYSTNADVLEELSYEYPIVKKILRYRTLSKLNSTYCEGLLKQIAADGRIHSTLNQVETRTGRISSLEPNLQNIPVRTSEGKEIRKFFIAGNNRILVDADYSQIELRVLAHISNDENMIKAFSENVDIHLTTASQVFNMPLDMVTPLMRTHAKAVNFGIVYGIGAFSLSKDIGVSIKEADNYIKGYLNHYSGIDRYMKTTVEEAMKCGYVKTLFQRRRKLPELSAKNKITRSFGERVARNMPIQGTAADIIKIAMINVHKKLKAKFPTAKLIMQVHDELIVECDEKDKEEVEALLKSEMENAFKMNVPLIADVHSGKTWFEAKN